MSGLDDRLRRDLERLAESPETDRDVFGRVQAKKARRRWIRRTQVAGLVVAVVAGTAGGTFGLSRVFNAAHTPTLGASGPTSANGRIAFVKGEHLYLTDPDGTDTTRMGELGPMPHLAWSSDGTKLALVHGQISAPRIDILEFRAETIKVDVKASELEADEYAGVAWSPDGRRLALSVFSYPGEVNCEEIECLPHLQASIWVLNIDGTHPREITDPSTLLAGAPVWLSNETIGFSALVLAEFSRADPALPTPAIYEVSAAGGAPAKRFKMPSLIPASVVWSPDRRRIAFIDSGRLYAFDVETGAVTLLVRGQDADGAPSKVTDVSWSPDGRKILYSQSEGDASWIYVANADGSDSLRIAEGCCAAWQPLPVGASPAPTPTGPALPNSPSHAPPVIPSGPLYTGCPGQSPFPSPVPEPPTCPTPIPAPPPPAPDLGEECDGSTIVAEFDGNGSGRPDGKPDRATVARSSCVFEAGSPDAGPFGEFAIDVEWGGGASGIWPLPACDPPSNACRISGAKDIDGDGLAELAITVHEGASTSFVELYRIPMWEPGPIRFIVAPPGDPPAFKPGEAARFGQGGTVTHRDLLACSTAQNGTAEVSAISAEVSRDQRNWIVHETTFTVDEELLRVTAVEDYQIPVGPSDLGPIDRSPCFGASTTGP